MSAVSDFPSPANPMKDIAIPLVLAIAIATAGLLGWNDGLTPLGLKDITLNSAHLHMRIPG